MRKRRSLLLLVLGLLASPPVSARDGVSAAVQLRDADVTMEFDDGLSETRVLRRVGVEYWEPVADYLQMGFTIGYSENDVNSDVRPVGAVAGNFGSLGARFDVPMTLMLDLRGNVEVLWQRDRDSAFGFEAGTREARADVAPVLTWGVVEFALGTSWRDIDYRETLEDDDGETTRRGDARGAGGFAAVGLHTDNDGTIALRFDDGVEEGWSLRFERTF